MGRDLKFLKGSHFVPCHLQMPMRTQKRFKGPWSLKRWQSREEGKVMLKRPHKLRWVARSNQHITRVQLIEENRIEMLINSIQLGIHNVFYNNNFSLKYSENLSLNLIKKALFMEKREEIGKLRLILDFWSIITHFRH